MPPTMSNETASEKSKEEKTEKKSEHESDLTDEDKQLLDELNLCVERLQENDSSLYRAALEILRTKIRSSTASLTSVPKPLKFLRPHYGTLKEIHAKMPDGENKKFCADVVSVLGMTMSEEERECLKYRLIGSQDEIGSWGHEYVRHLSGEVASEWKDLVDADAELDSTKTDELGKLIQEIIPYNMKHNGETDACDLLMEINKLELLDNYVDKTTYARVCLYLTSCVPYAPDPENVTLLKTTIRIFGKFNRYAEAMRLALQLNDMNVISEIFHSCKDPIMQKQLALILGRQQVFLELDGDVDEMADLSEIMSNTQLNTNFLSLARELDIMDPKVPEDIYKTHLENSRTGLGTGASADSARMNLASSYVNGFVNAGFGKDKMVTTDGNKWFYKNKDHGMLAATASLGLVLLWDVDGGLTQIDKYLYSSDDYIKSGALLACGIVNSGVRNECDPALALLSDYILHNSNIMRVGSILGLGLAYAGSNREDIISLLLPVLADSKSNMEVVGVTALACGLVAVGSCNGEVTSGLLQTLIERPASELKETYARYLALALGLVVLGKQEAEEAILAALEVVPEPLKGFARILVDVCAYAGTGNVLKIQDMLHICSEVVNKDDGNEESSEGKSSDKKEGESSSTKSSKKDSKSDDKKKSKTEWGMTRQAIAVIGIAVIGMGEDIGSEMTFRTFGHMFRYGEPAVRRAVPLALSLISISNPQLPVLDTLSKFSHDSDGDVAHNAIFGMGLVGSGTNNARLAQMLRNLAVYYNKDQSNLFLVKLAQGLVHLGKGTLTLQPYHSDRQLLSPVALAAILAVVVSFLDVKSTILGKSHYLLYSLVPAIQPRMLVTFDEELRPLPVSVRVGQAVDVVGQAGKPKTITGFQTHTTPVLLAYGERAELATEEYIPLNPVLEGFVILRKNPDYE